MPRTRTTLPRTNCPPECRTDAETGVVHCRRWQNSAKTRTSACSECGYCFAAEASSIEAVVVEASAAVVGSADTSLLRENSETYDRFREYYEDLDDFYESVSYENEDE